MKLTTRGRYAVMAMVDLARNGQEKPVSLSDIAERQGISLSYLEQLFSRLRKEMLVRSIRGPGGGYHLSRPAHLINISSIILAVDEPLTAMGCNHDSHSGCTGTGRCATHRLWKELTSRIHDWLNEITLAHVCEGNFDEIDKEVSPSHKKENLDSSNDKILEIQL